MPVQVSVKIDSKEVEKNFDKLSNGLKNNTMVKNALKEVAKQIYLDTNKDVPRDELDLLKSWRVEIEGKDILAGYDIIYAMYQHQGRRADGSHVIKNRPAGGKSFFLSSNVDKNLNKYYQMYGESIAKQLGL